MARGCSGEPVATGPGQQIVTVTPLQQQYELVREAFRYVTLKHAVLPTTTFHQEHNKNAGLASLALLTPSIAIT